MKHITLLGCLMLFLTMTLNAQHLSTQEELEIYENSILSSESISENTSSIEELLTRLSSVENNPEGVNSFFSSSEIQTLKSHFRVQNRDIMADIIPTAGATETFAVNVGDFFFDPGGPGGSSTGGTPGNYPNCGCVTTTTLDGADEIEFLFFSVFATFDWLKIYDGTNTSGPILYNNATGGANAGDITLADMISSNGSAIFTSTSGSLTFEFNASAVVDYGGWEVEILEPSGGGGGSEEPTAFGINNAAPSYGSLDPSSPAVFTNISAGSGTPDFESSGAIDPNDTDTGYVIDNFGAMWSLDVASGVYTSLGNIGVNDFTGLEFNPVDGNLYGTTLTGFYSVDIGAVSATLIGNLGTTGGVAIALAIDGAGNAFTYDIADDIFYSINTATGAATAIGPIGFNASFGQGMAWDAETDQVYMAAFNGTLFDTEWRIVDTTTGSTTVVGVVIPGSLTQMGWVSVINAEAGGGGSGDEWTVNVQGTGFGDEVSWELRDNLGTVILSGGNYGLGYNDTQTVNTENEPLEFYIESIGNFGDNTPSFTVSCSGEVVASGTLAGNEEVTESGLVCPGGGGGNNWECADAIALTCGDVVTGSTTGATNSGGNASPDVFYEYTGSGQLEFVTISLCDGGTNYDSYLRVFASCGNLAVGSEIVFNDDFCGLQSQLTFESDGTSTYIIMVEGFGTGSGDFSLEITCELPAPPPACGGIFTDTGGVDGDYSNNEDEVWTITPDAGDAVSVIFTAFDVEANWDALYVFDGPDTSSPLISSGNPPTNTGFPAGGYYGTTIPGPFTSTHSTGALTFRFLSDGSVTRPGWIADVVCAPVPPPNDLIVNAIDVDQFTQAYTDPEVRLQFATNELLNPDGCAIAGTNGVWYKFTATADGTAEASVTTPAGTTAVIFYAAPDEDVTLETDLVYTFESSNQCAPGTQASIATTAGQSYYIFVLNTGGESDVVIDISNSLGTNENAIDGFAFYPNPMENVLNIRSNISLDDVTIYNMLGQKVIYQNIGATISTLDVSGLSTGAYIMKVSADGQLASYQLIKK